MSNDMRDFYGATIFVYTREQALADGFIIDVSNYARRAGIKWPVAVTEAIWSELIKEIEEKENTEENAASFNKENLATILLLLANALRAHRDESDVLYFEVTLIPKKSLPAKFKTYPLKVVMEGDSQGNPCLTVLFAHED